MIQGPFLSVPFRSFRGVTPAACGSASRDGFPRSLLRASEPPFFLLAHVVGRHRRPHDVPRDDGKELESSIDFRYGQRCLISGAVHQTYGFFTRGSVIGGESHVLRNKRPFLLPSGSRLFSLP